MLRAPLDAPPPPAPPGGCSACLANSPFCTSCIESFPLPLLETLETLETLPRHQFFKARRKGFGRFDAIFMMTTPKRWAQRRDVIALRLKLAQIGPTVHIVNGSGVDELHRMQLDRQGLTPRFHQLAASWAHVAVAQHALKRRHDSILLIEDDAAFKRDAAELVESMISGMAARQSTAEGNWTLLRLGYSYRWGRTLSPCDKELPGQVVLASGPRDVRSSVAVAYRGAGIRLAAGMRFFRFGTPKSIDIILGHGGPFPSEHLALPPLVVQASATAGRKTSTHLNSALILLGKCANLTLREAALTPAGINVRAAWENGTFSRTAEGELALSTTLLNWTLPTRGGARRNASHHG